MYQKTLFLVMLVVILLYPFYSSIALELCTTPKNVSGECLLIRDCQELYSIVKHRPIKTSDADYLKRSHCGFSSEKNIAKVCCPIQSETDRDVTGKTTTTDHPPTDPPPNYELLPSTEICGIDLENRILGATTADLSEYPWLVLLEYKSGKEYAFYCGGVLINSRYVLTAAHCINGKIADSRKLVSVRLGEYNMETQKDCVQHGFRNECAPAPLNIFVEESIAHNGYDPFDTNQYHDIAIVRLAREVPFTAYVKPICLPRHDNDQTDVMVGKNVTVAGWGKTENGTESPVKLKLDIPIKENKQCSKTYTAANINLGSGQLCAGGEKGKDSCKGDSGGPLMTVCADENGDLNWYSVGVVSFGPTPCGLQNWPGVYTKVANYVPWIARNLRP